jgi:hypothetical protein
MPETFEALDGGRCKVLSGIPGKCISLECGLPLPCPEHSEGADGPGGVVERAPRLAPSGGPGERLEP